MTLLEESPILFNTREIEYEILTANALIRLNNLIQMEKEKDEPPDDGEAASFMDIHDLMRESANLGASIQP